MMSRGSVVSQPRCNGFAPEGILPRGCGGVRRSGMTPQDPGRRRACPGVPGGTGLRLRPSHAAEGSGAPGRADRSEGELSKNLGSDMAPVDRRAERGHPHRDSDASTARSPSRRHDPHGLSAACHLLKVVPRTCDIPRHPDIGPSPWAAAIPGVLAQISAIAKVPSIVSRRRRRIEPCPPRAAGRGPARRSGAWPSPEIRRRIVKARAGPSIMKSTIFTARSGGIFWRLFLDRGGGDDPGVKRRSPMRRRGSSVPSNSRGTTPVPFVRPRERAVVDDRTRHCSTGIVRGREPWVACGVTEFNPPKAGGFARVGFSKCGAGPWVLM
jgi:hypothetical protein